jgi:hypothetical protein
MNGWQAMILVIVGVPGVQALIQVAKNFGLNGAWVNLYAMAMGLVLSLVAFYGIPGLMPGVPVVAVALIGMFNGLAATGLWAYRRGDPNVIMLGEELDTGEVDDSEATSA